MIGRKIFHNKSFHKAAFRFAARRCLPRLAASLLKNNAEVLLPAASERAYRILALNVNKDGFLQDIQECFHGSHEFEVIGWPSYALPSIAGQILSSKINNNLYISNDPEIVASKQAYRSFLRGVWRHLSRIAPIDGVIAPNFHYSMQRDFAAMLEETGTPFIVLHKENLKSPGRVEFWNYMYLSRGKFSGRKILVYNETERKLQLASKVTDEDRVVVTGMPRLDRIHRWRRANAAAGNAPAGRQVLFFAFDRKDKLPMARHVATPKAPELKGRWGELAWTDICEGTHRAVVELARRRPDVRVLVKTKSVERQRKDVNRMLRAAADPLPPNLTVVNGGDAFDILTESSVIIGFNTTAQLEAIAAGKPVIVPWFSEALSPGTRDFVIDLGHAVEYARSPDELVEIACRIVDQAYNIPCELSTAATEALIRWTGNNDGAAGARVLNVIRSEVRRRGVKQSAATAV